MSTRVAFTVRLPEQLYRSIRVYAAEQGIDLQDTAAAAFSAYLGGEKIHAPGCPLCSAAPEEAADARVLMAILRKGSQANKAAVRAMLRALSK